MQKSLKGVRCLLWREVRGWGSIPLLPTPKKSKAPIHTKHFSISGALYLLFLPPEQPATHFPARFLHLGLYSDGHSSGRPLVNILYNVHHPLPCPFPLGHSLPFISFIFFVAFVMISWSVVFVLFVCLPSRMSTP